MYKNTNFNITHSTFGDTWDVNASVDPTIPWNGTYNLQAFWHNTDKTKVGTFTRTVDIIINTLLTAKTGNTIVIGDELMVKVFYKSIHNNRNIMNAPILCDVNWTDHMYMNQLTDGSYKASFDTRGRNNGEIGLIKISTQLKWFVNWTITLYVEFVLPPSTLLNTSTTTSSTTPPTSTSTTLASSTIDQSTTSLMTISMTESSSASGFSLIISFMLILSIFMIKRIREN